MQSTGPDRSKETVQSQICMFPKEQPYHGLHCLLFFHCFMMHNFSEILNVPI